MTDGWGDVGATAEAHVEDALEILEVREEFDGPDAAMYERATVHALLAIEARLRLLTDTVLR